MKLHCKVNTFNILNGKAETLNLTIALCHNYTFGLIMQRPFSVQQNHEGFGGYAGVKKNNDPRRIVTGGLFST